MLMAFVTWLRALNAVGTVAEAAKLFRGARGSARAPEATVETGATDLETGLANVVVAALREAFDRDRARFDLERDAREAERAHAEQALRLERLRQTGTHVLGQVRLMTVFSLAVWVVSAAAVGYLAPLPAGAKLLLGFGWGTLVASMGAAFIAHQRLTAWLATEPVELLSDTGLPRIAAQVALPWLLLTGFILTATSLIASV